MALHNEHSPDQSISARHGGAIAQNVFNENTKSWFIAVIMATSIFTNVALIYEYKSVKTEIRLKEYNFEDFRGHEFAEVKSQLLLNEKLITAFGPQQCHK